MKDSVAWLVFDLGGVLVEVAPQADVLADFARRSSTPQRQLAALMREHFTETPFSLAERFQIGEFDEPGFHAALNRELQAPISFDALTLALEGMLLGEKTDTVALLSRLRRQDYRIACYSNTNTIHWRYIQRHFGFYRDIERPFASQEVGYAKPDARGFDVVAAALEVEPQRCLLIDDRLPNVDGARAAGWQALAFIDAPTLERDLAARGIDVSDAA